MLNIVGLSLQVSSSSSIMPNNVGRGDVGVAMMVSYDVEREAQSLSYV